MAPGSSLRPSLVSALLTTLIITAGTIVLPSAPASAATTTVGDWAEIQAAFNAASGPDNVIHLGADIAGAGLLVPAGATVSLELNGHELTVTGDYQKAGIEVGATSEFIVDGPGKLTTRGSHGSAGIGGSMFTPSPGTIRILGGTIDAFAPGQAGVPGAAGIGAGGHGEGGPYGTGGTVEIRGGQVTAQGGQGGAGIGAGEYGNDPTIIIAGGTITATGGYGGAGLGGSQQTSGGTVSILGGVVDAIAGAFAAGIGSGNTPVPLAITIAAGTVRATGSNYGAAIGGITMTPGADLTIGADATVTAITVAPSYIAFGRGWDEVGGAHPFGSMNSAGRIIMSNRWSTQPGQVITNTGTIENRAALTHSGLIENQGVFDNTGVVAGAGVIDNAGTIRNTNSLTASVTGAVSPFSFFANDGVAAGKIVEVYAASMDAAALPESVTTLTRQGFSPVGWSTTPISGAPWDTSTVISQPTDLFAQWEITTHVVTFDSRNSGVPATQTLDYGASAVEPSTPIRANHAFLGWFDAESGGTEWNFATPITQPVTLYAQWQIATHVVTFEPWWGSETSFSQTADHGSPATEPPAPLRPGNTLLGWSEWPMSGPLWDFSAGVIRQTTLYARWSPLTYPVTFDSHNGDASTATTVQHGSPSIAPADPVRAGYTFLGWFDAASGGTAWNFTTGITGPVSLSAMWSLNSYAVTFDARNGQTPATQTLDYASPALQPLAPTRPNHTFLGWFDQASGGSAWDFADGVTGAMTLYAQWAPVSFPVTFDAQHDDESTVANVAYGSPVPIPPVPSRADFSFVGWADSSNCGLWWDFDTAITGPTTLYAQWARVAHAVTFDSQNGTIASDQSFDVDSPAAEPTAPTRAGYSFIGWFDQPSAEWPGALEPVSPPPSRSTPTGRSTVLRCRLRCTRSRMPRRLPQLPRPSRTR